MNLKVILIGTENQIVEHNFSGYEKQELNLSELEDFDDNLGVEVDGLEPENMYENIEGRLNDEQWEDDMETYGQLELKEETKDTYYQFLTIVLSSEEETEGLNEEIKRLVTEKGLKFEKTEIITSEDESAENKYLWENFGITGVDVFY